MKASARMQVVTLSAVLLEVPLITAAALSGLTAAFNIIVLSVLFAALLSAVLFSFVSKNVSVCLLIVIIFASAAYLRGSHEYESGRANAERLAEALGGDVHTLSGRMAGDVSSSAGRFFIYIDTVDGQRIGEPVKAYGTSRDLYADEGDYLTLNAVLAIPDSGGSFNMERYLAGKGAGCEIKNVADVKVDYAAGAPSVGRRMRESVLGCVSSFLSEIDGKEDYMRSLSYAKALMFGDKSGFDKQTLSDFSRCGITHLLCVSGLHFTILLGCLSLILTCILPSKRIRFAVIIAFCLIYLAACGFSASALRASVMALVAALCISFGTGAKCTYGLSAAVCLICLISPQAVYDVSFQLSVLSCVGIVSSAAHGYMITRRIAHLPLLRMTVGVILMSVGAFAYTFIYNTCAFGGSSTVSVIASALTVLPAQVCLVVLWIGVLPGALGLPLVSRVLAYTVSDITGFISSVSSVLASYKDAYISLKLPDISLAVFMAAVALSAFLAVNRTLASKIHFYAILFSLSAVIISVSVENCLAAACII